MSWTVQYCVEKISFKGQMRPKTTQTSRLPDVDGRVGCAWDDVGRPRVQGYRPYRAHQAGRREQDSRHKTRAQADGEGHERPGHTVPPRLHAQSGCPPPAQPRPPATRRLHLQHHLRHRRRRVRPANHRHSARVPSGARHPQHKPRLACDGRHRGRAGAGRLQSTPLLGMGLHIAAEGEEGGK